MKAKKKMKKIMIAVAVVMSAVMAQAAAVSWKSSKLYDNEGAQLKGKDAVTAYVYLMDAAAYSELTDVWGAYGEDVLAGAANASSKGSTTAYTPTITIKAPTDATANTTYYAAVITTYGSGDDMYYIAEKVSGTTGDDGNASVSFASSISTAEGSKGAWTAVPEPTSGLLMLVGLAGLALRRRRA